MKHFQVKSKDHDDMEIGDNNVVEMLKSETQVHLAVPDCEQISSLARIS